MANRTGAQFTIIEAAADDWNVWIQLEKGDPTQQGESFVIGCGTTRADAIADAVLELEATSRALKARVG